LNNTLSGGVQNDTLYGGADNDELYGGQGGQDLVYGGDGNDLVYGGIGNDTVLGGLGNATMRGGGGWFADRMTGGLGADVFQFHVVNVGTPNFANNSDTITDFNIAQGDRLQLNWNGDTDVLLTELNGIARVSGNSVILTFNAENQLTIQGVNNIQSLWNVIDESIDLFV
jgi:Ca2+-binding RTX toxin-like protein